MITNTHPKIRKIMEAQDEDRMKIKTFILYSVNRCMYGLYL